jgi:type IV pilus assembly protein PilQ
MRAVFPVPAASLCARLLSARLVSAPMLSRGLVGVAAAAALAAAPASAEEAARATSIESIEVGGADGGVEVAIRGASRGSGAGKIEFSLFRLSSPTRVVIDLPNADVAGARVPARFADDSLVSGVTTTQFRGRTGPVGRVVVVLRGDVEIDARAAGQSVILTGRRSSPSAPAAPVAALALPAAKTDAPVIELTGDDTPSAAARRITGVEAREQGDGSLVQIRTDGEVARYEIEEAKDPARLVIDIYGVTADKGERTFQGTAMSRARTWNHPGYVRVVLDARAGLPRYDVAKTGEGLAVLFKNDVSKDPTDAQAAVELRGLTFDRKNGFWRLKAELGGAVAVRTVKNAPDEKVIALDGVRAPARLFGSRSLAGGPVRDVVVMKDDNRADSVRIRLALADDVEHSVWQKDGAVFWDVREAGAAPVARAAPRSERVQPAAAPFSTGSITFAQEGMAAATYRGKKITLDLQDADIVNVIRLIGDVSGKNVVVGEDVKGKITLKLKNVPWDQALDVVLKTKDMGQETRGGIIRVVPQAKLDAEREARLKLQEDREKKLPTTVRLIPVNYAVAKGMKDQVAGLLSARGKVTVDDRTNVIIVEDIRENLDQAERLVRTLDTQTPQVLIEARMVEGSTTFSRSLGIQWGGGLFFSQRGGNPTGLIFPNNIGVVGGADDFQSLQAQPSPGVFFPPNFAVNLPASATNSAIGLNLGSIGNFGFLNARLSAAESSGQARVISAPRVTTLNNKRARITQGTDLSVPIATQQTVTIQTVKAALELDVTPHVTADGSILMAIQITNNVPDFGQQIGGAPPPVQTKEAETEMLVRDGDTAVIGGIYTRTQGETYEQTPFLGSIPILGWLFKSVSETDNRTEMLVFITPRIVNRRSATPAGGGLGVGGR